ncbi:recombination-associated protein RdgC, partial [Neisseria sp. P0001.S004]
MWFKQISFYPINKDKLPEFEVLSDKLAQSELAHCQGLYWFSEGFATTVS